VGTVRLETVRGSEGNFSWGMKEEEYMADFCLVSKRALEPLEYQIFRYTFFRAPTGRRVASGSIWTAAAFIMSCTESNRSWAGYSGN